MTLSIKNLDRICFSVVLLVILAGGGMVGNGWIENQKRKIQEEERISRRSAELLQVEKELQRLQRTLHSRREKIQAIRDNVPGPPAIGSFLKDLNGLIKKNSIELTSIRPVAPVREGNQIRIPVHLVCKGSFERIYDLLKDLEGMKKILWMEKMSISGPGSAEACGLELTMNIVGYESGTSSGKGA